MLNFLPVSVQQLAIMMQHLPITITMIANLIFDTSLADIDTAAAYACMQSIDNERLPFYSTGILTLNSGASFINHTGRLQ
jgi:hypothetical protein